jgi:hypothetical protein
MPAGPASVAGHMVGAKHGSKLGRHWYYLNTVAALLGGQNRVLEWYRDCKCPLGPDLQRDSPRDRFYDQSRDIFLPGNLRRGFHAGIFRNDKNALRINHLGP